jgi:hypothetical protein
MGSTTILKTAVDSFVTSQRPKLNRSSTAKLWMQTGGTNQRQAMIYFTPPFPMGANILNARLRIRNASFWSGSTTLTVSRITQKWSASKVCWDNRPSHTSTGEVSVTKTGGVNQGVIWEFNVTAMLQTVSNSGVWWGFKIMTDGTTPRDLFSANGNPSFRPELEVSWSDAPEPPEDLSPNSNLAVAMPKPMLQFDFTDNSGNTEIQSCQVQFSNSTSFTSPTWDSGTQAVSEPELDLSLVVGAPSLTGTSTYWRVRVQDASGLWSGWSEPTSMRYVAKPTVTLTSPAASPSNFVNDATPPILWTISGGTQTAYKLNLALTDDPTEIIWTSGKISTTSPGVTIPAKKVRKTGVSYRLTLMVWDTVQRIKNGTEPAHTQVVRDFTFEHSAGVAAPATVTVAQFEPWPWVDITFTRTPAPDEFNIYRDDEILEANVDSIDLLVSGSTYSFRDRLAAPRIGHTWSVQAVVNNVASAKRTSSALSTRLMTTMMMELDATDPIYFMNPGSRACFNYPPREAPTRPG